MLNTLPAALVADMMTALDTMIAHGIATEADVTVDEARSFLATRA